MQLSFTSQTLHCHDILSLGFNEALPSPAYWQSGRDIGPGRTLRTFNTSNMKALIPKHTIGH